MDPEMPAANKRMIYDNPATRARIAVHAARHNLQKSCRDIAKRYAEARQFRRDSIAQGWLNTAYALTGYIASLRAQWAFARRHP